MKKLLPAFALMLSASAFGFVSDWNGIKIAPEKTWLQTAEKKYSYRPEGEGRFGETGNQGRKVCD